MEITKTRLLNLKNRKLIGRSGCIYSSKYYYVDKSLNIFCQKTFRLIDELIGYAQ